MSTDRDGIRQAIGIGVLLSLLLFIVVVGTTGCTKVEEQQLIRTIDVPSEQLAMDGAPRVSLPYRRSLCGAWQEVWGFESPCPAAAAQIHQESGWVCSVSSGAGAQGCAQFMPGTAADVARRYPDLGPAAPFNPVWAFRAQARYMRDLHDAIGGAATPCDRYAFALAAYNGGQKWVERDRAKARTEGVDSARYWDAVEPVNAGRSVAAFTENRGYAPAVLVKRQPRYRAWGALTCAERLS